ncbi:MAG: 4-deoxy-4-formamido-L-arabinose-phosphoundecaprenol deformylase [Synergistaceae bacterium]|jgi:peptidoglycan/xylan/chitin deacetylase (PgdA/CDA1 family)|nr:4-deoxy-4-formamido-L-arabinose-phosphoundecaprenol deformylase [Synergistaceae bacterium]
MSCQVSLKIDVDTLKGYLEGVPRLLDVLGRRGIKASIFFSMGPDNSGKAIRRVFRKSFISKMLRTKAPSTYGWKTLLYGTLLKAPMIVSSNPDILKRAVDEGHDCGIHCWDHVLWQDRLPEMPREKIREELARAVDLFSRVAGVLPRSSAAPGWQVSRDSLTVQDELRFDYCSDVRGAKPFYPRMDGVAFRTLQIPSTLPTLDELWGREGLTNAEAVHDKYLDLLEPGLNVHTVHAEMEGGSKSDLFARFLDCCIEGEAEFPTLRDVASDFKNAGPADVELSEIPGRAGKVAVQKAN